MLSQEKEVLFIGSIEEVKNNFPSELLDLPNWVVSEVIFNEKKSAKLGYAKFDKFPKALDGIHGAKSNDSSTWHSFEEVAAACQSLNAKNRRRDVRYLPGFMMGAGYCGLDFDGCLQGSELNEKVRELMEKFDGAYFEVSVSGRGIRGFIKAKKLFSSCDYLIDEGVVLEIYDKGRFFVCTGSSFNNDKVTISDCQTVLDEICKELGETDEPVPPSKAEKEYSNDEAPTEEEVEELKEALKALPFDEYFGKGTYSNGNWRNVRFALQWRFIKDRDVGIALMDEASSGTLHRVPAPESYIGYKDIEARWDDHNTAKHSNPITIGWLFDKARNYGFDISKFRSNRLLDKLKSRQTTAPSFNENLSEFTSTVLPEPMIKYNDLWRGWLIAKAYCTENRFVLENGDTGAWINWNGKYWEDGYQLFRAKAAYALPSLVGAAGGKKKNIQESCSTAKINSAITEARAHCISYSRDFNRDPLLFNLSNGTYDLGRNEFHEHRRTDKIRGVCANHLTFDPAATCPKFDAVLLKAMAQYDEDGNLDEKTTQELIDYLWRVWGYCLTDYISEKCFWLFVGRPDSGKSLIDNVINGVLGKYASKSVNEFIKLDRGDKHSAVDHQMIGKRKMTFTEARKNERLNEEKLKAYTGEKRAMTRGMAQNYGEYAITAKIFINSNFNFLFDIEDEAFIRRVRLIRFKNSVPKEEQIPDYDEIIIAEESAGILNKMIAGYHDWKQNGMQTLAILTEWLNENLVALDSRRSFIVEACLRDPKYHTRITILYDHYERYCQLAEKQAWDKDSLKEMLISMGHREGKKSGLNGFYGIKPDEDYLAKWVKSKIDIASASYQEM